jgi:hypothetical protein
MSSDLPVQHEHKCSCVKNNDHENHGCVFEKDYLHKHYIICKYCYQCNELITSGGYYNKNSIIYKIVTGDRDQPFDLLNFRFCSDDCLNGYLKEKNNRYNLRSKNKQ